MKAVYSALMLTLAVLAGGCGKPTEAVMYSTEGSRRVRIVTQSEKLGPVVLADQAAVDRIANAAVEYLEGPNARLRNIEFVNIAKPIKTSRNGQEAEAVYVQFRCVNNYADAEEHQRDLLIVQGGKVLEHFRNREEIENRLSSEWYRKNPPPGWPRLERPKADQQ